MAVLLVCCWVHAGLLVGRIELPALGLAVIGDSELGQGRAQLCLRHLALSSCLFLNNSQIEFSGPVAGYLMTRRKLGKLRLLPAADILYKRASVLEDMQRIWQVRKQLIPWHSLWSFFRTPVSWRCPLPFMQESVEAYRTLWML